LSGEKTILSATLSTTSNYNFLPGFELHVLSNDIIVKTFTTFYTPFHDVLINSDATSKSKNRRQQIAIYSDLSPSRTFTDLTDVKYRPLSSNAFKVLTATVSADKVNFPTFSTKNPKKMWSLFSKPAPMSMYI
jgi:hypothetical protein